MQISIVLCTYNGADFLKEQLDSLTRQSVAFSELIIIDDGSTDRTVEILRDFEKVNEHIKLHLKNRNKGVTHSFEEGIKLAKGDYIFLCDQDDIWVESKIEKVIELFDETEAELIFSDARCINNSGESLGYSLWNQIGFTKAERLQMLEGKGVLVTVRHNVASGCCMAFSQKIKKDILPLVHDNEHLLHDRFILAMTVALYPDSLQFMDEQLVDYRVHDGQKIGLNRSMKSSEKQSKLDYYQQEAKLIEQILKRVEDAVYRRGHYFWTMRAQSQQLSFLRRFIMLNTLFLEGDYKRFTSNPIRAVLGDLWG